MIQFSTIRNLYQRELERNPLFQHNPFEFYTTDLMRLEMEGRTLRAEVAARDNIRRRAPDRTGVVRDRISDFFRKAFILISAVLLSNPVSLILLGLINRLLVTPVNTGFICYAAHPNYRNKYWFRSLGAISRSYPMIIGAYRQGGSLGLIFIVTAIEQDFRDPFLLARMVKTVDVFKKVLGIKNFHYSGILPTELAKKSLLPFGYLAERCDVVAEVVLDGECKVRAELGVSEYLPIILLGGRGNVGRAITKKFRETGRTFYIVDLGDLLPAEIQGQPCIVIDVARKGALDAHLNNFWNGMIFLNEAYPAPSKNLVQKMKSMGISCFHLSGVMGRSIPSFPVPYSSSIPCCAIINTQNSSAQVRSL